MKIDSLKELNALLTLCHKQGVRSITIDGITMAIGDVPEPKEVVSKQELELAAKYNDEDMLLWSANG